MSHEKNLLTFHHYTGCLIGILIMAYYNPYITGYFNPLYNPTSQGFFHCSIVSFRECILDVESTVNILER